MAYNSQNAAAVPVTPGSAALRRLARRRQLGVFAIWSPPFLYLLVLYIIPMLVMVLYSLGKTEHFKFQLTWTLEQYQRFVATRSYQLLLLKSLRIAILTTVLSLILSYPMAYFLARVVSKRWQYPLLLLLIIPSWTSFIIRTYSWILILGRYGLVNSALQALHLVQQPLSLAFNEFSVDVAILYVYLPWVIMPIYASLEKIDPTLLEAGEVLGAGPVQNFLRIVFPLSLPGVAAAILMSFVPAVGSYAIPMILGGRGGYMYGSLVNAQYKLFNWPLGAALSVIMLGMTLVMVGVSSRLVRLEELWIRP